MRIDEFIDKYINTKVDFDKMYGFQCTDLFRQYCKDVLNIPHTGSVNGAKDLYLNYLSLPLERKYFKLYEASQANLGDVVVWDASQSNKYGHVAIVISVTGDKILVLEQDGFKQDGVKMKLRPMANTLGVLRFIGGKIV